MAFIKLWMDRIVLSAVVIAEIYAGINRQEEKEAIDAFVAAFPVIPITVELAKEGGRLKRHYQKSHGIGLMDALIAATVMSTDAELKTLNVKHYPMLKHLKPPYQKG